jgi:hypothetical protein
MCRLGTNGLNITGIQFKKFRKYKCCGTRIKTGCYKIFVARSGAGAAQNVPVSFLIFEQYSTSQFVLRHHQFLFFVK